jgi:hypothetical protein
MSRFAPGASFAVVSQKDGSFAVEVHEPKRAVPLRITGYGSEEAAKAAIEGFAAAKPPEPAANPVAPAKLVVEPAVEQPANVLGDKRSDPAVPTSTKRAAASAKSPSKQPRAATARKPARKRPRPRR